MSVEIKRNLTSQYEISQDISENNKSIRPKNFDDFPGQDQTKQNLKVFIKSAIKRKQPLDHVLLHGPAGLGKTTLANIIARELDVEFYITSAPVINKPGDLAGILSGLEYNGLLFIDEIHRLSLPVEEILYSAMEDFVIDIVIGQGGAARTIRMPIKPFTLVGATTRLSLLSRPLLTRFGIQERMDFYTYDSLIDIIIKNSHILGIKISENGAFELAKRSRGTPRIANRLLRRIFDFAVVENHLIIEKSLVDKALKKLNIDKYGLDKTDLLILKTIYKSYNGGPVGLDTLSVTMGENKNTIEDVYEPYLVYIQMIKRGHRGRYLTEKGINHIQSI